MASHDSQTTDLGDNDTTTMSNEFPSSPIDTTVASSESSSTTTPGLPPIVSVLLSNIFLFFLVFGLSATVQVRQLKHQLQNTVAIGTGVMTQFFIMPFLGFLSVVCMQYVASSNDFTYAMGITLLTSIWTISELAIRDIPKPDCLT